MTATLHAETISTVALVVETAVALHSARGTGALEMPLIEMVHSGVAADTATLPAVVAVEDRVVELVVDDGPFEAVAPAIWALAARGWDVVALSVAARMGEAHRALRGTPCRLQPWWTEGENIRFGAFETP